MLFCTFKATTITSKTIIYVFETLSEVVSSTPIAICNWINKPHIQYTKKYCKTSNGSGKFSNNLRTSKKPSYNEQNCKSGRHSCQHTFMKHKSRTKRATTNTSSQDLKIKDRKFWTFKSPPPRRLNHMLRAINFWKHRQDINDTEDYSSSYDEPDLCNDYISMEKDKADRFSTSFPRHCVFGHVLLDNNPLDEVDSWKELVRPFKKPRSVDQRKSNPIQTVRGTTSNKKLQQKDKKSRSVTIQAPEDRNNKDKEPGSDNTTGHIKPRSEYTPNNPISKISDLQELMSVDDDSTLQRMTSVAGYLKTNYTSTVAHHYTSYSTRNYWGIRTS